VESNTPDRVSLTRPRMPLWLAKQLWRRPLDVGSAHAWIVVFRRWTGTGSLAVADEFLFASSHLILNLGLARWLPPFEFGAFTIAYAVFLLFGAVHTALLTEPLMVFGSGKYKELFDAYLRVLVRAHLTVTIVAGVILVMVSVSTLAGATVSRALLYLGVCAPVLLLSWLVRRACYAKLLAHVAALGGVLYSATLFIGLIWLAHAERVSIGSSLVLMAVSSAVASLFMMYRLRSPQAAGPAAGVARQVLQDHWEYGRWALGSAVLTWVPSSVYYFILPRLAGIEAAGALKAVMNFVLPVLRGYLALSLVLLPSLCRTSSVATFKKRIDVALPLYVVPALVYCVIVIVYHERLFHWIYLGRYTAASWLLPVAAPMVIAAGVGAVYATALRALQRPQGVFWSYALASGATLSAGVWLTLRYQLFGAVLGLTLSYVITAVASAVHVARATATIGKGETWRSHVSATPNVNNV
jgi:O-antigen/teichoic acid export membrane protein